MMDGLQPAEAGSRGGFGIVEAVMALLVMAIMLTALLPAFVMNMRTNTHSELRTAAVTTVQRELDNIRAGAMLPTSGSVIDVAQGAAVLQMRVVHEDYCADGVCYSGARDIILEVSHNGRPLYRVQTIFTALDATGL